MRMISRVFVVLFTGLILFNSCKKDDVTDVFKSTDEYSAQVATEWMDLLIELTKKGPGFTPPVAARAFGYTGLTFYESVRPGMPNYKSLAGQINGLSKDMIPEPEIDKEYHWGLVANAAVATIVRACYSNASTEQQSAVNDLESHFMENLFTGDVSQIVFDRSVAYGKSMGDAMVLYALSDGQANCFENNFPDSYVPPVGTGLWVPTVPAFQRALQPYWGDVRPFLTKNVADALPPAPPTFSTDVNSQFWQETMEVYEAVNNLTPEQNIIAKFWSDDPGSTATPPGHSLSILKQVLEKENANLTIAAEAFAKIGMGVHDAFISCWNAKFTYNLLRPISIIHEELDENWTIPLNTPPFPEYTSGHSVQSGAAAQILTDLFGDNYAFVDRTHEERVDIDGSARSFSSFFDMADEAAISRLYGGIHFRSAIDIGVEQGKEVGSNISALNFK